ncbi:hypothetical protein IFM89_025120 [Coptis chinensis]|uniref:Uncharacterized protein n=1 Tax=Coptis chinensis TaxID=261450 RepID=A0A835M0P6_9MAGN|nr:hypothetical protein IFM89_025120 [Coptis chinensis]
MVSGAILLLGPGEEALACFPALTNSFRAPAVVLFWKGGKEFQMCLKGNLLRFHFRRNSGHELQIWNPNWARQPQEQLKKLKDQLASTEAAKREAQEELEKNKKEPVIPESEDGQDSTAPPPPPPPQVQENSHGNDSSVTDTSDENSGETDVFEVPMATVLDKTMMQEGNTNEQEDNETKSV